MSHPAGATVVLIRIYGGGVGEALFERAQRYHATPEIKLATKNRQK